MLNSNEPIKVAHLQKLANQSILNDTVVMGMANNSWKRKWKQEKLWSFEKVWNVLIEKINIWAVTKLFPLDFANYLSYSEMQKNRNVVNIWKIPQQVGSLF